eukprot:Hpha_TRINITY_DN31085_c0_g1::TRINITY_DN31085_c0_g1_i1::g.64032::m.64032
MAEEVLSPPRPPPRLAPSLARTSSACLPLDVRESPGFVGVDADYVNDTTDAFARAAECASCWMPEAGPESDTADHAHAAAEHHAIQEAERRSLVKAVEIERFSTRHAAWQSAAEGLDRLVDEGRRLRENAERPVRLRRVPGGVDQQQSMGGSTEQQHSWGSAAAPTPLRVALDHVRAVCAEASAAMGPPDLGRRRIATPSGPSARASRLHDPGRSEDGRESPLTAVSAPHPGPRR